MDEQGRESVKVTLVGLCTNIFLTVLKGSIGLLANSAALVADAGHSFSDLLSDIVTLWAVNISRKPGDSDHPYGHGKFETLGTLFISLMLMVAGLGLALHGINHIDAPVIPGIPALWMAGLSIVFKETLYQYSSRIAKRNSSRILLANAWHHRTDAISSIVALIGIAGALRGYPIADPIAAILVSGWILKTGITIGYGSVKELTDIQVEQDVILSIHEVLRNVAGVEHYHQIRARRMGPYILVDLHIEVRNEISISVGHQISERVRHAILKEIPSVNEVLVHIDIENDQEEESLTLMRPQKEVEKDVRQILAEIPEVKSMTHFMCHYLDEEMTVQVTIIMEPGLYVYEAQAIAEKARDLIEQIQDIHSADIHLEFKEHSG